MATRELRIREPMKILTSLGRGRISLKIAPLIAEIDRQTRASVDPRTYRTAL